MNSKNLFLIVIRICVILTVFHTFGFSEIHAIPRAETKRDSTEKGYLATIGYWNDNIVIDEVFGDDAAIGQDDHITASFWLQLAFEDIHRWWFVDVYYSILTDKADSSRTDIMTIRPSVAINNDMAILRFGVGLIATGNFGGELIQNGYHNFRGFEKVNLPYMKDNEHGWVGFVKLKPFFYQDHNYLLNGYFQNSYRSSVGPSCFRMGLEFTAGTNFPNVNHRWELQNQGGYVDYYLKGNYFRPYFKRGFTWGTMLSWQYKQQVRCSFWVTSNQYGLKQPHFGISFSFGFNTMRLHDLSDVSFP